MVAMTAGAIAISSMFFISSASTHYFRVQQRLSNMQSSLRLAMDQLRRDVSRAGFGGTPSQAFYPACSVGAGLTNAANFRAIRVIEAGSPAVVDPIAVGTHRIDGVEIHADALRLFGNYSTSSEYRINNVSAATITLSPNWQTFTRDFSNWSAAAPDPTTVDAAAFNNAFLAGRLVRARAASGSRFFSVVTGTATGANPSVTVAPAITSGLCAPLKDGLLNPVSIMEYRVQNANATTAHQSAVAAGANTQLVRRELDPTNVNNLLPGNTVERIVAERVVHFNVDLLVNQNAARNVAPAVAPVAVGALNNFPERIFSAIITLAVRAPLQDPRFPWMTPTGGELTSYRFSAPATAGLPAARVRTARAEIFLPNIAYEWAN